MKLCAIFFVVGIVGTFANDVLWMEILSSEIAAADGGVVIEADKNIPELAGDLGLKILVKAVTKAELVPALSGKGPLTVFGPTDKAFMKLPKPFIKFLLKNVTVLADILKYHVASGEVLSGDLKNDMLIPSLQGKSIRINIYNGGKVITASGRQVILADQKASNGVIHEVSGVLFPPPGTITYVVANCPVFSTLLKAVKIAGLASTLNGEGPFTLFAPSDKAFAKIPKKCIDALLKNVTLLKSVLLYHVVPSTAYSAGLTCGEKVKTAQGEMVKITKFFGQLRVNWAKVTYADGSATNGVVHVIDRVLFPRPVREMFDLGDNSEEEEEDDSKDIDVEDFFNL